MEQDGAKRIFACRPTPETTKRLFRGYPAYALPPSSWEQVDLRPFGAPILDQDSQGSCVGHGGTSAFTIAWLAAGRTMQRFSPAWLYSLINGGRDQGANVGDALQALLTIGGCLESQVPALDIYQADIKKQANYQEILATCPRYKVADAYTMGSFEEVMSFITAYKRPLAIGIDCGANFNPAADGRLPTYAKDRRYNGHCLCVCGSVLLSGTWYALIQNSWGTRWGLGGYCLMGRSYFDVAGSTDNFGVICDLDDPQDPDNPPEPK